MCVFTISNVGGHNESFFSSFSSVSYSFSKARSTIIVILMNNIARCPKKPLKLLTLGGKQKKCV